jgi:hypothetical protein
MEKHYLTKEDYNKQVLSMIPIGELALNIFTE